VLGQVLGVLGQFGLMKLYLLCKSRVGCAEVASANVETVFSGAGRISVKSRSTSTRRS
jgi:hypothetical protein